MNDIRPKVDSTRDQAANLMANRGDHCRKVVEPKISELNRRFAAISHRIKTGKVGRSAPRWKLVVNDVLRRLCSTLRGASNPRSKVFKRKMKARMYLRKFYHWISWEINLAPFPPLPPLSFSVSFSLPFFFFCPCCSFSRTAFCPGLHMYFQG